MVKVIIAVIAYIILAPIVGGFLAGLDRKITARMQGRVGPPVLQPFYDVLKLLEKESITVNRVQDFYVMCFFIFVMVTGGLFFAGENLLLVMFTLTLASVFLIVAAFSSNSPYSEVGAERELLQMLAYELIANTNSSFFLTGRAGTGKTTCSKILRKPSSWSHIRSGKRRRYSGRFPSAGWRRRHFPSSSTACCRSCAGGLAQI